MNLAVLSYFVYLFTSLSDYIKLRTRHFLKIQLYFDFQSDQVKKVIKLANFLPEAFDFVFFGGYIYNEKKNRPSRLLPIRQWPHGNSCTWAQDGRLLITGTSEPKSARQVKQGA